MTGSILSAVSFVTFHTCATAYPLGTQSQPQRQQLMIKPCEGQPYYIIIIALNALDKNRRVTLDPVTTCLVKPVAVQGIACPSFS